VTDVSVCLSVSLSVCLSVSMFVVDFFSNRYPAVFFLILTKRGTRNLCASMQKTVEQVFDTLI